MKWIRWLSDFSSRVSFACFLNLELHVYTDVEEGNQEAEVLIKVVDTTVSRADTIQRVGGHPPPKGASPYLGLECCGIVEQVGSNVSRWKIGDQSPLEFAVLKNAAKFLD